MSRELDVVTISGKELDDLLDRLDQADEEVETMKANGTTAAFDKVNDQLAEANRENAALLADRDRLDAELARVRRNHLRRMAHTAWLRRDYPRSTPISARRRAQYERFALACRDAAGCYQPQDGTTEGEA